MVAIAVGNACPTLFFVKVVDGLGFIGGVFGFGDDGVAIMVVKVVGLSVVDTVFDDFACDSVFVVGVVAADTIGKVVGYHDVVSPLVTTAWGIG